MSHLVNVSADGGLDRNRLSSFFRPILATLVTGVQYESFGNIASWIIRFQIQTRAYLGLLTDRYPELDIEPRGFQTPHPA